MTALSPTPTPLDRRVLDALPAERPGVRLTAVVATVQPREEWRRQAGLGPTSEDVRGILRGFEHLGQATGRGGWWRRLEPIERERTE